MSWRVEISKADAKDISDSVENLTETFIQNEVILLTFSLKL